MAEATLPFVGNLASPGGQRRLVTVLALVAIAVAIGFVGRWASTPTYVTLFSGLDLKEVGRAHAEAWLKENFEHIGRRSTIDINQAYL